MLALLKDPYERNARLTPGLLVALPILVPLICVYGPKNPILVSLVTLLSGSGAIYALASIARGRGKKVEELLIQRWGGLPSTIALRHRDCFFDSVSKRRYHADIAAKLGIPLPTADEEAADPSGADDSYTGATRRLRELTRGNKQLLLKENVAYGFHRNMLGMKPVGLLTSILGVIYGLVLTKTLGFMPLRISVENLADPGLAGGLTLAVAIAMLAAWLFYFNEDKVRRIGFVYAERLFECLPLLPPAAAAVRKSKQKAAQ